MKNSIFCILFCLTAILCIWAVYAYTLVGEYQDKLWLHRANSIEKWQEKADTYPNAEVDLIFCKGKFHVAHDTAEICDLTIDSYFAEMNRRQGKLWLDIKNFNPDNISHALRYLDSLCLTHQVEKERLIVESDNIDALSTFTHTGKYFTSYYVKSPRPSELSTEERNQILQKLNQIANSGNVSALSFPHYWYNTIRTELHSDIPLLTWDHHTSEWLFHLSFWKRKMLQDPQVKVILVKSKGKYHR